MFHFVCCAALIGLSYSSVHPITLSLPSVSVYQFSHRWSSVHLPLQLSVRLFVRLPLFIYAHIFHLHIFVHSLLGLSTYIRSSVHPSVNSSICKSCIWSPLHVRGSAAMLIYLYTFVHPPVPQLLYLPI